MPSTAYRVKIPVGIDINDARPYAFSLYLRGESESEKTLPFHRHPNGLIGLSLQGGRFAMDFDHSSWPVPRHAAVYVPPGVVHNAHLDRKAIMLSFHIAPEVCEKFLPQKPTRFVLNAMTEEMLKHFTSVYKTSQASITAKRIASLIIEEVRMSAQLPVDFALLPEHPLLRRIAQQFAQPKSLLRTVDDWAALYGMSGKTFSRLVLSECGITFGKWRNHFRLLQALEVISDGNSVEEAAAAAQYGTTSSFIDAFRRVFGCTPGVYRRQHAIISSERFFEFSDKNSNY